MKLYLSSYRIPSVNTLKGMLPKNISECSMGIIRNAKDFREDKKEQEAKLQALIHDLVGIGFEDIYLIDLHEVEETFDFALFDVVYGAGGNTFALNYALCETGHDSSLREFINNGGVYIGESAGALIVGALIDKFDEIDDKKVVPKVYGSGLGIIDEVICPHADNIEYAEAVAVADAYYKARGYKTVVLSDNQAYVVNDNERYIDTGKCFE